MTASLLVVIAIAIPVLLAGALLPPLLIYDRMQTLSGTFPDGLRSAIGSDGKYNVSAWDYLFFILLSLSAFTPEHIQQIIAIGCAILLAIYAAIRMHVYLKARNQYFGELNVASRRILLIFGIGAGFCCLAFTLLSATLVLK
jgi:hypothetical protein